jgi:steroid 5-alpha reductase family enzyme
MFDEILGLPAHPLIIHAAVILTPLLAVLAVVYALVTRTRPVLTWAVTTLAVIVPVSVFAARQSGEALKDGRFSSVDGELGRRITDHSGFATPLMLGALALGVVSLGLVYVSRAGRFPRPVETALAALTVILALVAGYYVVRAGHSGAVTVWGS